MNHALKAIRDFCYPDGYWAGYARFFEPTVPGRIGSRLIDKIHQAYEARDYETTHSNLSEVRSILSNIQIKFHHNTDHETECYPTKDAEKLVALINQLRPPFDPGKPVKSTTYSWYGCGGSVSVELPTRSVRFRDADGNLVFKSPEEVDLWLQLAEEQE